MAAQYETAGKFADGRAVSKLSPYLRSGQLSPRMVWQAVTSNKQ